MLEVITVALKVVESSLNIIENKQARSHIVKIRDLKLRIRDAETKAYDQQDDNEIVRLYQDLKIFMEEAHSIISSGGKK